jgi:hypothetical protein
MNVLMLVWVSYVHHILFVGPQLYSSHTMLAAFMAAPAINQLSSTSPVDPLVLGLTQRRSTALRRNERISKTPSTLIPCAVCCCCSLSDAGEVAVLVVNGTQVVQEVRNTSEQQCWSHHLAVTGSDED